MLRERLGEIRRLSSRAVTDKKPEDAFSSILPRMLDPVS